MNILPKLIRTFYPLKSGRGTIANSRILKKLDGNPDRDVEAQCGRFRLVIPENDYVGRSIKYFGDLDEKISWVIRNVLQPGDTAVDIGANLGLVSFKMLECVGVTGRVVAFEPQTRMTSYIERSIALNSVQNLLLQKMGLGDKPGTLRLSIPDENAGGASFCERVGSRFEEVPVTTLDDFWRLEGLNKVRLVKIDVEGFEPQVVSGGREFLTTVKPEVIVFEENRKNPGSVPESIGAIQSCGYEVFSLPKAWFSVTLRPYQNGADAHDFVAIHNGASGLLRRKLGV